MAGFRTFATGEVLTAANVNNFLMKQSVMVFEDADARTAALGAETVEGMLTYNKDTDQLEVFDGTNFVVAAPEQNLVAVKSDIFTGIQSASVDPGENVAVTDLTITHEVADAANKLIISAFFGAAASTQQRASVGIGINDGSGLIAIGNADGSRTTVTAGGMVSPTDSLLVVTMPSVTFVHTPGAGEKTYTVRAINIRSETRTLFINRSEIDDSDARSPRAVSSLVIQEVKV